MLRHSGTSIVLNDLKKELARREVDLVSLGDAYVDFGNRIERLNNIARNEEQIAALKEELWHLHKAAVELAILLKQDFL